MNFWKNRSLGLSIVFIGLFLLPGNHTADDDAEEVCPCQKTCSEDEHEFGTIVADIADFGIQSNCEDEELIRCCPKEPPPTKNLTVPLTLQEICFLTPDELKSAGHDPSEKRKCAKLKKLQAKKKLQQEQLRKRLQQQAESHPAQQQSYPPSPYRPSYYPPSYPPPTYQQAPTNQPLLPSSDQSQAVAKEIHYKIAYMPYSSMFQSSYHALMPHYKAYAKAKPVTVYSFD